MTSGQPDTAGLPLVTAAILAYNRRDALAVTLGKLHDALDYPRERLEVIVVDNASTDGTAEMVRERFPDVRLIVRPDNAGIGGWNQAFQAGRGDWFLVLDDDCYMEGDALRRALASARDHAADMVSFSVDSTDPPGASFSAWYRTGLLSFWGCAVLVSRGAIESLGGFDTDLFIWCHEVEFTMRFLDRGFAHLVLPDVHAVHMKGLPELAVPRHMRNMHNWAYVVGKLMRPADAAVSLGNLLVRSLVETAAARGYIAGLPAVLRGFRAGLRARQPVRAPVSRLYRRDFLDFAGQVRLWPRLRHLIVDRRAIGADYRQRFWADRPGLYPTTIS